MDNDQFESLMRTGEYSDDSSQSEKTSSETSSSDSSESYSLTTEQTSDQMRGFWRMIIKVPVVLIIIKMIGESQSDGTYILAIILFLVTHFALIKIFPKDKDCW